jgi:transposase
MECEPGAEAQVVFGRGAPIVRPDGKRQATWVFRIVLSHSRKGYSEAVHRQTTDDFLRSLENAFVHFSGLPKTLVIDNLRAAVARADWFDSELSPKARSFAEHYGIRQSFRPDEDCPSSRVARQVTSQDASHAGHSAATHFLGVRRLAYSTK